jgi:hypothetical protein
MAAEFSVVHLKIRNRATQLTPPAVAAQDLLAQTFIRQRVQPRGLPDGLYYLCLTDSLIRRDQRHAFDNGRGRDQPVCRVFWKASR